MKKVFLAIGLKGAYNSLLRKIDPFCCPRCFCAAGNQALIELMDSLAANAAEEQLAYLTDVFVNCSRYELGFWDMAWELRI